jgi:hypothetical protein
MGDVLKLDPRRPFCPWSFMVMAGQPVQSLDCGGDDCELRVGGKCAFVRMAEAQEETSASLKVIAGILKQVAEED